MFGNMTRMPTVFEGGVAQGAFMVIGGPAGDHALDGIVDRDTLLSVEACEFTAGVPTAIHDLTDEFSISEDGVLHNNPATGTNTTGMLLVATIAFVMVR